MKNITILFVSTLCSLILIGCGQTGPLYKPADSTPNKVVSDTENDTSAIDKELSAPSP